MTDVLDMETTPVEVIGIVMAEIETVDVTTVPVNAVEVTNVAGASDLQSLQDYLSLDGGRAGDVYDGMESLDGGGV